jgi:hypothetical protein
MDPITLLVAVLGIYGSGIVAKAGEDTFDHCRQLLTAKLKGSDTGRALAAGTEIDPEQTVIDVEAIALDPEVQVLTEKIQQLIAQNEDLQRQFNEAIRQQPQVINKNWQGINAETGSNVTVHNPTFNF